MAESRVEDDVLLTKADVVALTVDELRCELRQRGRLKLISGLNKTQLQVALLQAIGQKPTTPVMTGSGLQATGPSTAPLTPPSDHEQADLDNVADWSTLSPDLRFAIYGFGSQFLPTETGNWQRPVRRVETEGRQWVDPIRSCNHPSRSTNRTNSASTTPNGYD